MIYIFTFILTTILFATGDHIKKKRRIWIDAVGIIVLCSLAGMRGINVGVDTFTYLQPSIKAAIHAKTFSDYWRSSWLADYSYRSISQYEIGYVITVWIVAKVFKSIFAVQFVMQLLVIAPIYYVLRKTKYCSVWLGMLTYELLFYNGTFNMIRQSIACAFTVLTLFLWKANKKKSIISLIVGTLYHTSALIGIVVIFLYSFVQTRSGKSLKINQIKIDSQYLRLFLAIIIGILAIVFDQIMIAILKAIGLGRYVGYLGGNVQFLPNQIIYRLPGLILLLLNYKNVEKYTENGRFFICMIAYSMLASQFYGSTLVGGSQFGGRINQFFGIYNVIIYPAIVYKGKYKKLLLPILILYLFAYWYIYYFYNGIDGTLPYRVYW
jgi:hypothetical protein